MVERGASELDVNEFGFSEEALGSVLEGLAQYDSRSHGFGHSTNSGAAAIAATPRYRPRYNKPHYYACHQEKNYPATSTCPAFNRAGDGGG